MQPHLRAGWSLLPIVLGILPHAAHAQTGFSSINSVYAVVGARIEVGNGKVIAKGTVLVRDGLIEAVGADVKVPPEAEIIKGEGLTVYPGFIDAHATRGITPPEAQPNQDVAPDPSAGASPFMREANRKGIRPELRAGDYLALTDDILKPARASGFTTELIVPSGGTINGMGALVNLNGLPRRDSLIKPDVAMNFTFRTNGSGYPGSLMGIFALTRQTLLDARRFQLMQTAFAQGGSRRPPADEGLASLLPVLNGSLPVLFDADSENEIRRAILLADEFGMKLMLSGGSEAYKTIPLLAQYKIPVLVSLNFAPEPGAAAPTGPDATPPGTRPGSVPRPGSGNRRPPTAPGVPPAANAPVTTPTPAPVPAPADTQTPAANGQAKPLADKPATPEKPGQEQGKPTPPNPNKEDALPPNAPPNQANKPVGTPAANPNADDEESYLPPPVLRERHRQWEEKVANAAMLHKAGIPFAFSTIGTRSQTEFLANLRRAIAAGLPREAALRALTSDAAHILGIDRQMGTIEPGKTAALVVMSGDFAVSTTRVRYLLIDRSKFEPDRDIGPLPNGPRRRPTGDDEENGASNATELGSGTDSRDADSRGEGRR